MKTVVKKPVEIEVTHVRMELPVRYGNEDMPRNFPGRNGDVWTIEHEIKADIDVAKMRESKS